MKYFITLLLLLFFATTASAQLQKEVGLRAIGLDNGSLLYRVEQANGKWRRLHFGLANLNYSSARGDGSGGLSLALAIGWEHRRRLADRLEFLHGWEPFASIRLVSTGNGSAAAVAGGVGYVLGFQYAVSDHFFIALETTPAITAMVNDIGNATRFQVEAGFDSSSVALTAVYRFTTE